MRYCPDDLVVRNRCCILPARSVPCVPCSDRELFPIRDFEVRPPPAVADAESLELFQMNEAMNLVSSVASFHLFPFQSGLVFRLRECLK